MYTLLRRTKPSENIPLSATKVDNAGDNANPARRPPVKSHLGRFNMHISIHKAFLNNHARAPCTPWRDNADCTVRPNIAALLAMAAASATLVVEGVGDNVE